MTKTFKITAFALLTLGAFSLAAAADTGKHRGDHRSGDTKTEVSTVDHGKRHEQRQHHRLELVGDKTDVSGSDGSTGDSTGPDTGSSDTGSSDSGSSDSGSDHSADHGDSGAGSSDSGSDK